MLNIKSLPPPSNRLRALFMWPWRLFQWCWSRGIPMIEAGGLFLVRAWREPSNPIPKLLLNYHILGLGVCLGIFGILAYGFIDSLYVVDVGQEGVHIRLGRMSHVTSPGLNFKAPYGIDEVVMVNTNFIIQDEFGYRSRIEAPAVELSTADGEPPPDQGDQEVLEVLADGAVVNRPTAALIGHPEFIPDESEMLTGNLNIIDISWAFQYEVVDSYQFLFRAADVNKSVRDISRVAMAKAVGNRLDVDILTKGRAQVAEDAKKYAQQILDELQVGIQVNKVIIQDVSPPPQTQSAYHEVSSASQHVEHLINQAEKDYHTLVQKGYGEGDELINTAQAYRALTVSRAEGEASRYRAIAEEYAKAPHITQERIYIDTMQSIFSKVPYMVVDKDINSLLPLMSPSSMPLPPISGPLPGIQGVGRSAGAPHLNGGQNRTAAVGALLGARSLSEVVQGAQPTSLGASHTPMANASQNIPLNSSAHGSPAVAEPVHGSVAVNPPATASQSPAAPRWWWPTGWWG